MRSISRRVLIMIVLGLTLSLPLSGCSASQTPEPAQEEAATAELRLGLTEWSIETGGATVLPGEVQVQVTNAGGTAHDVVIHGQEGTWASPVLEPGEIFDLTITAVAGEVLHLVCTLTGHESQGMHTELKVANAE